MGVVLFAYYSVSSGMFAIICKPPRAPITQRLYHVQQQRKCHYVSADERQEIMQTLRIANGAIESSRKLDEKRITLILRTNCNWRTN